MNHTQAKIPATMVEQIDQPDGLIQLKQAGDRIVMAGVIGVADDGAYKPEMNLVHAFMQTVHDEFDFLMSKVLGRYTDADRFRALRDFAMLANTDKERFEKVNGMLQQFEEQSLPVEQERKEGDFTQVANFLCHALIETAPALTAPTAAAE